MSHFDTAARMGVPANGGHARVLVLPHSDTVQAVAVKRSGDGVSTLVMLQPPATQVSLTSSTYAGTRQTKHLPGALQASESPLPAVETQISMMQPSDAVTARTPSD